MGCGQRGAERPPSPCPWQRPTPARVLPAVKTEARPKNVPRAICLRADGSSLRLARKGSMTWSFRGTKASKTTTLARSSQASGNCRAKAGQAPALAHGGELSISWNAPAPTHQVHRAAGSIPHRIALEGAGTVLAASEDAGDVEVQTLQVIRRLHLKGSGTVAPRAQVPDGPTTTDGPCSAQSPPHTSPGSRPSSKG